MIFAKNSLRAGNLPPGRGAALPRRPRVRVYIGALLYVEASRPMTSRPRPLVLCILDGWGERPPQGRIADDDAIARAKTPVWHDFMRRWPHAQLDASEHY